MQYFCCSVLPDSLITLQFSPPKYRHTFFYLCDWHFYRATLRVSAVLAVDRRLSVCPSHSCLYRNDSRNHHSFSHPDSAIILGCYKISREPPRPGFKYMRWEKFPLGQYIAISWERYKIGSYGTLESRTLFFEPCHFWRLCMIIKGYFSMQTALRRKVLHIAQ